MPDYLDLLRPLLTTGNVLYFVYDLTAQRAVYASEAYEQLIGDPLCHLADDLPHLLSRLHPDDRQYLGQLLADPAAALHEVELRLARPQPHSWQWLSLSARRTQPAGGPEYVAGAVRDITTQKEAMRNAQKFNTKKDATLEIVAHDLATPFSLLLQLTEQLTYEVSDASEIVRKLLHLMQTTCTQGINLIHDFVDNEFLASANVSLRLERADLVAWLRLIVQEYQRAESHVRLQFSFEAAEPTIYASFDINKLQQVINNLISNAIKFTPDGGTIQVSLARRDTAALLTVADTGVGIPAALQAGLFEKFTKARRPGLRGEKSTGLGMSIIKTIVDLHQGRIWLDSAEGQGATFYLELPALPPPAAQS